jgi:alkylation response protein AidB-like acyl-CoA dehydrogenase
MTFVRTDEQRMLADTLATVLSDEMVAWQAVVPANGLDLLGVPEEEGGLGPDARDAAVVAEALGRAGIALPWADHWVAYRSGARGAEGPRATRPANAMKDAGDPAWAEDALTTLHCAEIVGLCDTMLRDTALFLQQRRQFGTAIAQFQVLRHRMADMAMILEQARAATDLAIDALESTPERARTVSAARVLCDDAARIVGEGAVQSHGAMGLTAELRLGRFFRRARTLMQGDGGARTHLRRYAG